MSATTISEDGVSLEGAVTTCSTAAADEGAAGCGGVGGNRLWRSFVNEDVSPNADDVSCRWSCSFDVVDGGASAGGGLDACTGEEAVAETAGEGRPAARCALYSALVIFFATGNRGATGVVTDDVGVVCE